MRAWRAALLLVLATLALAGCTGQIAKKNVAQRQSASYDPIEKINVHGGAISIGHPIGASGTRLFSSLLNALEAKDGQFGLQVMCEAGGLSNATIVERLR